MAFAAPITADAPLLAGQAAHFARDAGWATRDAGWAGRNTRWLHWLIAILLLWPVLLFGSHRVLGWAGYGPQYSVSVPVTLRPYDPALWSTVTANSFAAARASAADLPDPTQVPAQVPALAGAAEQSALDPANLRLEAYVGPAARPYVFRGASATDTARAHYCLTAALYYEAASESDDGMRGVAQVVLNRVRHPSFPASICGVVFQGSQRASVCQFTFACDGSMARTPARAVWSRASRIAAEALAGRTYPAVGLATHYHTLAVSPAWGKTLVMTNVVGAHIFHRWRGRWGESAAFSRPYAGREPEPGPYLPIADQLAARGGRALPATGDPALAGGTVDPAALAAINAARNAPGAPVTSPAVPGFASNRPTAAVPAPSAAPAPYADPRLAGSGSVREEYRNSGSVIQR